MTVDVLQGKIDEMCLSGRPRRCEHGAFRTNRAKRGFDERLWKTLTVPDSDETYSRLRPGSKASTSGSSPYLIGRHDFHRIEVDHGERMILSPQQCEAWMYNAMPCGLLILGGKWRPTSNE